MWDKAWFGIHLFCVGIDTVAVVTNNANGWTFVALFLNGVAAAIRYDRLQKADQADRAPKA